MAFFRVFRGVEGDLPETMSDGYMYFCTDTSKLYIDHINKEGMLSRSQVSSKDCETILGLSPSAFAEKIHAHQISDIEDLQKKLDELTPPSEIETSEDVIIRVNQLSLAINDLNNTLASMTGIINDLTDTIDALIPSIGEIYITTSNENPVVKFGGVWEQIKDTFLLASGDLYVAGSIGGEATHTLTIDEIPSHTHQYKRHAFDRNDTDPETGEDVYGANNKTLAAHEGTTEATGNGQPHNNMPPYLTVYVWKRVA